MIFGPVLSNDFMLQSSDCYCKRITEKLHKLSNVVCLNMTDASSVEVSLLVLLVVDISHRRSQDFVCGGALFFTTQQKLLKIDSCSGWGCTSCPAGVHLHIFPVN